MTDITEKQFMAQIKDLATTLGYRFYHPFNSMHSERGWPDCALFRTGRFLLAELKTDKKTSILSPAQESMIADLRAAGVEVHVWRPSDFDEIVKVLR